MGLCRKKNDQRVIIKKGKKTTVLNIPENLEDQPIYYIIKYSQLPASSKRSCDNFDSPCQFTQTDAGLIKVEKSQHRILKPTPTVSRPPSLQTDEHDIVDNCNCGGSAVTYESVCVSQSVSSIGSQFEVVCKRLDKEKKKRKEKGRKSKNQQQYEYDLCCPSKPCTCQSSQTPKSNDCECCGISKTQSATAASQCNLCRVVTTRTSTSTTNVGFHNTCTNTDITTSAGSRKSNQKTRQRSSLSNTREQSPCGKVTTKSTITEINNGVEPFTGVIKKISRTSIVLKSGNYFNNGKSSSSSSSSSSTNDRNGRPKTGKISPGYNNNNDTKPPSNNIDKDTNTNTVREKKTPTVNGNNEKKLQILACEPITDTSSGTSLKKKLSLTNTPEMNSDKDKCESTTQTSPSKELCGCPTIVFCCKDLNFCGV